MSVESFRVEKMPSDINLRLIAKHDTSLASVLQFIAAVTGSDAVKDLFEAVYVKHFQCIRFLEFRIRDALHMLYPIHCYISSLDAEIRASYDSKQFDKLLDKVNQVYEPHYSSPGQVMNIVRDVALYVYIALRGLDICAAETETLAMSTMDNYKLFKLITETFMSPDKLVPVDILIHRTAGLYDAETGEQRVMVSFPMGGIMFFEHRFTVLYNLYAMFMLNNEIKDATPVHDMLAIKGALSSTLSWQGGGVVERCRGAETLLRVAPDSAGLPSNPLSKCPFCKTFDSRVYSPVCHHVIGCTMCTRNVTKKECQLCKEPLNKVKVFLLIPELGGVRDEEHIDARHLCERLVPGVQLGEPVYKNVASMKLDVESVTMVARYLALVTNKREDAIINRAQLYFATNCTVRRDGDEATWWRALWMDTMPKHGLGIAVESGHSEIRGIAESTQVYDSDEDSEDSDLDDVIDYASYSLDDIVCVPVTSVGRATLTPINEYIKAHPEHTINEVLSLVKIDKVYKTTDSCVVCMDSGDLVVMSSCKHQVSCLNCSLKNGNRCPVCRSLDNTLLQIV